MVIKRYGLAVALLVFLALFGCTSKNNFLRNGSFEDKGYAKNNQPAASWHVVSDAKSGVVENYKESAFEGENSLVIKKEKGQYLGVMQPIPNIKSAAGKKAVFSCRTKTGVPKSLFLILTDGKRQWQSSKNTGSQGWENLSVEVDVPKDVKQMQAIVFFEANSEAYADSAEFYVRDNSSSYLIVFWIILFIALLIFLWKKYYKGDLSPRKAAAPIAIFFAVFILGLSGLSEKAFHLVYDIFTDEDVYQYVEPKYSFKSEDTLDISVTATTEDTYESGLTTKRFEKDVFGGALFWAQTARFETIALIIVVLTVLMILAYLSSVFLIKKREFSFDVGILAAAGLMSIILSLRLSSGWDELFVNLRHSYVLANYGKYSFNFDMLGEGTVDFLLYFLTGVLGLLKLPLLETLLSFTLIGNLLMIFSGYLIAKEITKSRLISVIIGALLALFPPVLLVGATGFTATFYSGWVLLSFYFLFFREKEKSLYYAGLIILGLLTLIRTEGILIAFLFFVYKYMVLNISRFKSIKDNLVPVVKEAFIHGLILSAPFLISCVIREIAFGSFLPNPMIFKNPHGDSGYYFVGVYQLAVVWLGYGFDKIFLLLLGSLIATWKHLGDSQKHKLLALLIIAIIVPLPYYTGGGDWLPREWARYLIPSFSIFIILAISIFKIMISNVFKKHETLVTVCALLGFSLLFTFPSIRVRKPEGLLNLLPKFENYYVKAYDNVKASKNRWERIGRLAMYGEFLKKTTPKDFVISSPEIATMMYFAERNILGLLGTINKDIAYTKINPYYTIGNNVHRKRNPQTIKKNMPEVLAFVNMVWQRPNDTKGLSGVELFNSMKNKVFTKNFIDTAYYRGGSYYFLESLGYRYIFVFTPQWVFNYMVHQSVYDEHLKMLSEYGIKHRSSVKFKYNCEFAAKRYTPDGSDVEFIKEID